MTPSLQSSKEFVPATPPQASQQMKTLKLYLTRHAAKRFMERTNLPSDKAMARWVEETEELTEMELKPKFRINALLNHKLKPALYYRTKSGLILVVSTKRQVMTVHCGTADRWVEKKPIP